MRATLLVVGLVALALGAVSLPDEASLAPTASANLCTPHLVEGDVKSYARCTQQQCQWDPPRAPVCTD